MVKVKVLEHNVKTGKTKIVEKNITLPPTPTEPEGLNIQDAIKLIKYAKSKGWI
jgi:hypothetical protein